MVIDPLRQEVQTSLVCTSCFSLTRIRNQSLRAVRSNRNQTVCNNCIYISEPDNDRPDTDTDAPSNRNNRADTERNNSYHTSPDCYSKCNIVLLVLPWPDPRCWSDWTLQSGRTIALRSPQGLEQCLRITTQLSTAISIGIA
jgi:hypothetical protein